MGSGGAAPGEDTVSEGHARTQAADALRATARSPGGDGVRGRSPREDTVSEGRERRRGGRATARSPGGDGVRERSPREDTVTKVPVMGEPTPEGRFGRFGGRFVPETLVPACADLERAFRSAWGDPEFRGELDALLRDYAAGRRR